MMKSLIENEALAVARVYDIADCGPHNRFVANGKLVHNSGGDGMNWQNLARGGTLRSAIYAPEGQALVVVDSRNIEARILDWLAGQEDMVEVYRRFDRGDGPDVYCIMASKLYQREITIEDKTERQLGKTVKLSCGYGTGGERMKETARTIGGLDLSEVEAKQAVDTYRQSHPMVVQLWNRAQSALSALAEGPYEAATYLDLHQVLRIEKGAFVLPNGLRIKYPQLSFDAASKWSFAGGHGGSREHLFGGKLIGHCVQALAKILVMDQLYAISKQYRMVMTSHDEGVFLVNEDKAEEALVYALEVMSHSPSWALTLPVAASGAIGVRYGEAKG